MRVGAGRCDDGHAGRDVLHGLARGDGDRGGARGGEGAGREVRRQPLLDLLRVLRHGARQAAGDAEAVEARRRLGVQPRADRLPGVVRRRADAGAAGAADVGPLKGAVADLRRVHHGHHAEAAPVAAAVPARRARHPRPAPAQRRAQAARGAAGRHRPHARHAAPAAVLLVRREAEHASDAEELEHEVEAALGLDGARVRARHPGAGLAPAGLELGDLEGARVGLCAHARYARELGPRVARAVAVHRRPRRVADLAAERADEGALALHGGQVLVAVALVAARVVLVEVHDHLILLGRLHAAPALLRGADLGRHIVALRRRSGRASKQHDDHGDGRDPGHGGSTQRRVVSHVGAVAAQPQGTAHARRPEEGLRPAARVRVLQCVHDRQP
mmetsp:Transcript_10980/g.38219  ORF Transcript_10980/g.38219 Transcript_10980/m.38219 type:complete len:388 (-) Transcript_10980:461-1624(-)